MLPPMANEDMHAYWNSDQAELWVDAQPRFDAMLAPYAGLIVEAADFHEADRVLDIGCGTGALTRLAGEATPYGSATGVDIGRPSIELARKRSAALTNVSFHVADAQVDDLPPAEVVVSRFGIMFFDDPASAFENIHRATEPDGRFVFTCWRSPMENEWVHVPMAAAMSVLGPPDLPPTGAPGPFALADHNHLALVLTEGGWRDLRIIADDRPFRLGGGLNLDDATDFTMSQGMIKRAFGAIDAAKEAQVRAAIRDALAPYETDDGVTLGAAAWLVEARTDH